MAVLVSDKLQKHDCARCRVAQAQFGDLCAVCHYRESTNRKMRGVIERENVAVIIRNRRKFLFLIASVALTGATIFLLRLWR